MQPTMEILEKVSQNSQQNRDEVFTRLFRYMLRPDIYFVAYKHLYPNQGAGIKGVNSDTADGFSEEKVNRIIQSLKDGSYAPSPVRRTYIPKKNGKLRPLGIPTFTDKLVQEVLRMILEAVYEPLFLNCSHGFRPGRSCHTALQEIKKAYTGIRWFVEGDIKGFFDHIDHHVLVGLIGEKVKDAQIRTLLYKMLRAGYLEDWQYNATYSGTPQGGIISPLLANIYLHELDKYMMRLANTFDRPKERHFTPAYSMAQRQVRTINRKLDQTTDSQQKAALLKELRTARKHMMSLPAKSQTDKRLKYVRYADDFLIGINGDKTDCECIKMEIKAFLAGKLKLELSDEKTLITHSSNPARFLGYDIRVRRSPVLRNGGNGKSKRTLNGKPELNVPLADKIERFLFEKKVVKQVQGELRPISRPSIMRLSAYEILATYNAELRGLCNYYGLASNYSSLQYFAYLMEYSCLKTLAAKHQSSVAKMHKHYKDGQGHWGVPYETKSGTRRLYFAKYLECKKPAIVKDTFVRAPLLFAHSVNSFESKLKAKECQFCGTTDSEHYEVHHVNRLRDLQGKAPWERIMLARRRKTMVVCRECHYKIHAGTF